MGRLNKKTGKKPNTVQYESLDSINLSKVSARHYQDLFNNASDAIFIRDLKGNITEVNEAAVTLTGYTRNELTRMNISEFLTAESFKLIMKKQKALLEDETATQRYELEIIGKDGVRMNAESRTNLLTYKGRPLGVQCIVRDITERKRAEEQSRKQNEFPTPVLEAISQPFYVVNVNDYTVRLANSAARFGSVAEKLTCYALTHNRSKPCRGREHVCPLEEVKKTKKPVTIEHIHYDRDGSARNVEIHVYPILDEGGNVSEIIEHVLDITERKRVEEALRENEERFRSLAENTSDWIWEVNVDGVYTYASPKVKHLLGYEPEEVVGKTPFDLMPPEEAKRIAEEFRAIVESQRPFAVLENTNLHKDGRLVVLETSGVPFFNADGRLCGYRGIDRNITERKRLEEALRERTHSLGERVKELNCLFGISSLVEKQDISLKEIFQGTVDLMPPTWQYPEVTCARIILEGQGFKTDNFKETTWKQTSDIVVHGDRIGTLEVCYLEERPKIDEGPFLKEERLLIDAVAERLGKITERKWVEEEISKYRDHLEKMVIEQTAEIEEKNKKLKEDIAEQKRIEETLRASEERFRSIYEESPIGIELYDCDGRLLTANRACLDIFGVSNIAEVQGFKLFEDPNVTDEVKQRLHKGKTVRYEALFDFEKVKKHKLYNTSKSGAIYLNVLITSLGVRGEKPLRGYLVQAQDITERKRAEEALQESEQNFRNSLDDSPLGIRIVTAEGKLLYANQAILDIYGYSSVEELKSVPAKQRYTPKSYAEHQERIKKREQGKPVPVNYEISIVRKDGEVRHLAVFRKEVIWGSEIQFQTLYQDITERKLTAEKLRIFKAISDRAGYGAGISTPDGNLVYVNESFAGMHGYTIEELIGKHLSIFHTREQMKLVERLNKKLIQAGSYVAEEVWHKKKDGTVFPTLMTGTAIKDDMEKPLYLSATAIDITERKRVEMALQQSEEFNSSILANSPCPILVLNADASIRYVNPALEKLTGFSSAELIGRKPPYPWWTEETREPSSRKLAKAMLGGVRKYESLYRKKNGERFWAEKIFKAVKVSGELKYHLVNWIDLTEQKRLRENMEFYVSEITKAQEEERKRIAHEIHDESVQSLSVLALDIDAIAKEKERLPEDIIQHLERLRAKTNSILEGLRTFSHELRPGVIDLVGLVPALEILTEELNKGGGVNTSLVIAGSERRLIPETELVLFRIAQEALHNVRRHSGATKVVMKVKFTRRKVRLTVFDNGGGFELPDMLSDLATEGKLGLIGMQERARLLNGRFLVKSQVGKGTTVVVEVAA